MSGLKIAAVRLKKRYCLIFQSLLPRAGFSSSLCFHKSQWILGCVLVPSLLSVAADPWPVSVNTSSSNSRAVTLLRSPRILVGFTGLSCHWFNDKRLTENNTKMGEYGVKNCEDGLFTSDSNNKKTNNNKVNLDISIMRTVVKKRKLNKPEM